MFEYTVLVDAPVQRFTSIVTGPDPDDEPVTTLSVATRAMPVVVASVEAPVLLMAAAAEPFEGPDLIAPGELLGPLERIVPVGLTVDAPAEPTIAPPVARTIAPPPTRPISGPLVARRQALPPSRPPFMPALVAVAAAGLTAMWWLRRDAHDR